MGQAKQRGTYEDRVKQAQSGERPREATPGNFRNKEAIDFIMREDSLILLDLRVDGVVSSELGISRITDDTRVFPMDNTHRTVAQSVQDSEQFLAPHLSDVQKRVMAWGNILAQCFASAHTAGIAKTKPFAAYITAMVHNICQQSTTPVKQILIKLNGLPNNTGLGSDPYITVYAPDSVIELKDKAGRVIERVDYAMLMQGKTEEQVLRDNVRMMGLWEGRLQEKATA